MRIFFIIFLFFISCNQPHIEEKKIKTETVFIKDTVTYTYESYINKYKRLAQLQKEKYGIPASIIMAQAILESTYGNSDLVKNANNHFGIKCNTNWDGVGYYKDAEKRDECYRVYNTPEESFNDHSIFLKRERYNELFKIKITEYKKWALGLKKYGYATNPDYAELLIDLIERYQLYNLDKK